MTPRTNYRSGIYVPDDERWPAHFRGVGIRIEDSVCVGDDHPIVLTPEAVKEVRGCKWSVERCANYWLRWMISRPCVIERLHPCTIFVRYPPELVYNTSAASLPQILNNVASVLPALFGLFRGSLWWLVCSVRWRARFGKDSRDLMRWKLRCNEDPEIRSK